MTVVLDLDGTLVSTYCPQRAPRLPPGTVSFVCGQGSRLNPKGVLVIERPGLRPFLRRLSAFAGAFGRPLQTSDHLALHWTVGLSGSWDPKGLRCYVG